MTIVRRARPWLGTIVEIRAEGLSQADAVSAIDAAFAEVATVHRLMSFHDTDSDLSRLHRDGEAHVDARTFEVIATALRIAESSRGAFDPTIAAQQVRAGSLPRPTQRDAEASACWRDIELRDDNHVRLRKPLWIDLGGIAKGYAVDRAIDILMSAGATQACINAGGDLRICGERAERVIVRGNESASVALELSNAAVATSTVTKDSHIDGITRRAMQGGATASVVAPSCMIADALTKVVLVELDTSLLTQFSAQACVHDPNAGWRTLDCAA